MSVCLTTGTGAPGSSDDSAAVRQRRLVESEVSLRHAPPVGVGAPALVSPVVALDDAQHVVMSAMSSYSRTQFSI